MEALDVALAMREAFVEFLKEEAPENIFLHKIKIVVFDMTIYPIFKNYGVPDGKI